VLRALGFAPAEVDLIMGRRPWADPAEIPGALRRGNQRTRADIFRVEAWAGGAEPVGRVLTAVVERQTGTGQAEAVPLAWRWSEAPRLTAPPTARSKEAAR